MSTAIIYYCYNRIDHTKKSLSKILEIRGKTPLYVFCDGYKKINDCEVNAVREYVKNIAGSLVDVEIIFRKESFGLAKNVIFGINNIFNKGFDSVIVLEDDCVPQEDFFRYMYDALTQYQNETKVKHISGFALPMKYQFKNDNYFTPYPCSWGWGTWKKEWFECNFEDYDYYKQILNDSELKKRFDSSGKSFSHFLKLQLKGEINSWLIRWYAHIFKEGGVCSWAVNTQIKNIGFDGTGEHKVSYDRFNQNKLVTKEDYYFKKSYDLDPLVIREFRQHFMGPKLIDKVKTMIYLKTGIILEKLPKKIN